MDAFRRFFERSYSQDSTIPLPTLEIESRTPPLTAHTQRNDLTIAVVNHHVIRWKVDWRSGVSGKISTEDFSTVTSPQHIHRIADLSDVQRRRDTHRDEISGRSHRGGAYRSAFENDVRTRAAVRVP